MVKVRTFGSTGTYITFIVSSSQVLSINTILKELISEVAWHGRRWTDQTSPTVQGPILQPLSTEAIMACLDLRPTPAEWIACAHGRL